jgi:hypothetical protein
MLITTSLFQMKHLFYDSDILISALHIIFMMIYSIGNFAENS